MKGNFRASCIIIERKRSEQCRSSENRHWPRKHIEMYTATRYYYRDYDNSAYGISIEILNVASGFLLSEAVTLLSPVKPEICMCVGITTVANMKFVERNIWLKVNMEISNAQCASFTTTLCSLFINGRNRISTTAEYASSEHEAKHDREQSNFRRASASGILWNNFTARRRRHMKYLRE